MLETDLPVMGMLHDGCPIHFWYSPSVPVDRPLLMCTYAAGVDDMVIDARLAALAGSYPLLSRDVRGRGAQDATGATPHSMRRRIAPMLTRAHDLTDAARRRIIGRPGLDKCTFFAIMIPPPRGGDRNRGCSWLTTNNSY